jgi:four helix bundle protein
MLDYERLDVYQCSLQFAALSFRILGAVPRGHAELSDQLRRATTSIPLNIAEGAGKTTLEDRARYHAAARGSAMECSAIIDLLRMQGLAEQATAEEAKSLLVRLVAMLTRLCR